jgi:elongation of very long chain fatty acids protein 4
MAASVSFAEKIMNGMSDWARPAGNILSPYKDYPFASAHAGFYVAVGYLAFVAIGRSLMKDRKPIEGLYGFKFAYNFIQVMLCSYMSIEAFLVAYRANYKIMPCEPFNQHNPVVGDVLYIFYVSKILDFMDTVFIIAECRWEQLSFLHVYHHFTIFLFYWLNLQVGYDGDVYLTIILNGFIHAVMYTYYFVTLHVKDIWWKPFLTKCQMIQFVCMMSQAAYLMLAKPFEVKNSSGESTWAACEQFPRGIVAVYFWYIFSLLVLFYIFSVQDEKKRRAAKKAKEQQALLAAADGSSSSSKPEESQKAEGAVSDSRRNSGSSYDELPLPKPKTARSPARRR